MWGRFCTLSPKAKLLPTPLLMYMYTWANTISPSIQHSYMTGAYQVHNVRMIKDLNVPVVKRNKKNKRNIYNIENVIRIQ